jgi:hypothetical protein
VHSRPGTAHLKFLHFFRAACIYRAINLSRCICTCIPVQHCICTAFAHTLLSCTLLHCMYTCIAVLHCTCTVFAHAFLSCTLLHCICTCIPVLHPIALHLHMHCRPAPFCTAFAFHHMQFAMNNAIDHRTKTPTDRNP